MNTIDVTVSLKNRLPKDEENAKPLKELSYFLNRNLETILEQEGFLPTEDVVYWVGEEKGELVLHVKGKAQRG